MSGYAYGNNGLSYRAVENDWALAEGEVFFSSPPTTEALETTFAGYTSAANAASGQAAYAGALRAGCQIVSTGTASLNATYALGPDAEDNYLGLQAGIAATPPAPWLGYIRDINGSKITMTAVQATEVLTGLLTYMEALDSALAASLAGSAWAAPPQPTTIA